MTRLDANGTGSDRGPRASVNTRARWIMGCGNTHFLVIESHAYRRVSSGHRDRSTVNHHLALLSPSRFSLSAPSSPSLVVSLSLSFSRKRSVVWRASTHALSLFAERFVNQSFYLIGRHVVAERFISRGVNHYIHFVTKALDRGLLMIWGRCICCEIRLSGNRNNIWICAQKCHSCCIPARGRKHSSSRRRAPRRRREP